MLMRVNGVEGKASGNGGEDSVSGGSNAGQDVRCDELQTTLCRKMS